MRKNSFRGEVGVPRERVSGWAAAESRVWRPEACRSRIRRRNRHETASLDATSPRSIEATDHGGRGAGERQPGSRPYRKTTMTGALTPPCRNWLREPWVWAEAERV